MAFFGSTIQEMAANKLSQPYYRFDGVNDLISFPSSNSNYSLTKGALEFRVKFNSYTTYQGLIYIYDDTTQDYLIIRVESSTMRLQIEDGNSAETALTFPQPTLGVWHHMVFVQDGTEWKYYLNGVEQTLSGTNSSYFTSHLTPIRTYMSFSNWGTKYLDAEVSKFGVYNLALSATEVKELYSGASVPFKYKGANQTNMITSWTNTSFDTCTTSGTDISSLIGDAGDDCYSVVNFEKGKRYRLTLTTSVYITGVAQVYLTSTDSTTGGSPRHNIITHTGQTWPGAGETDSWEFTAMADYDNIVITQNDGTDVNLGAITGMSLVPIGAVAEYDGSGATGTKWYDKSGNNLDGTVTGASLENKITALNVTDDSTFAGNIRTGTSTETANTNFDNLVIEDVSGHSGITIFSKSDSDGAIYFGDVEAHNLGQIKYSHGSNVMTFATNDGAASLTLDSGLNATFAGDVTINGGNDCLIVTGLNATMKLVAASNDWTRIKFHPDNASSSKQWLIGAHKDSPYQFLFQNALGTTLSLDGNAHKATFAGSVSATGSMATNSVFTCGTGSSSYAINVQRGSGGDPYIQWTNGSNVLCTLSGGSAGFASNNHILPSVDNSKDLGSSAKRWANLYVADIQLSNEGNPNEVDGTEGNWSLQEGEEDLYVINRKTGKKFKIKLEEM